MKKAKVSQFLLVVLSLILITFSASSLVMANDVKNEIDNYLSYYTKAGSFIGAVLVARDNEILFSNGYGFADYELDVYNKINNIFRIGSLTKSFTAVSIMQLQEKNLLCVTDPLNKYIKNFPNGEQISIHNLLNHTSGIVNFTSLPKYQKNYLTPTPIKETINSLKEKKLNFDPGTKFEYSNSNYIILGYIIEKVTGQSYEDYLKENIFKPLDMNDSGFAYHHKIIENRSKGYQFDRNGEKKKIRSDSAITAHAAGALYSTVDE